MVKPKRSNLRPHLRPNVVVSFELSDVKAEDGEPVWEQIGLVVCFKFSSRNVLAMQHALDAEPFAPQTYSTLSIDSRPTASEELPPGNTVRAVETDGSSGTFVPFEREWVDETQSFNMKKVIESMRSSGKEVAPLTNLYNWFPDAVPIDAILPPGVPLSAKEINAYYPHHIRWKDVMIRLISNSYRGPDIIAMQAFFRNRADFPIQPGYINSSFRDSLKSSMPGFFTVCPEAFKGKPERNLYTDHLSPGKLLHLIKRPGYITPTFEDLLKDLVYLPVGLDARGLTQCLVWYLNVRDMFSPRLELNVLHTQSLIWALQIPLKSYGPQNLDLNALQEWKANGQFAKRRVEDEQKLYEPKMQSFKRLKRSRVAINCDVNSVNMDLVLPLRHLLTFPFLSMVGMAGKALEKGIEKVEARRTVREAHEDLVRCEKPKAVGVFEAADIDRTAKTVGYKEASTQQNERATKKSMPLGYQIPKRRRPVETPQQAGAQTGLGVPGAPPGPRMPMTYNY
ncbi:hypothetical protein N0V90_011597 [Kalmusia sp. IMI 367209]|nr:hypothetical protein N0V90_011597 [Kalmusia sp. IMI 367209]